MSTIYKTKEGDVLDAVAFKFYGSTDHRVVEQILEANRGLADYGEELPAGLEVVLPEIETPAQKEGVRLWS
ncbi:tail protein X (plasmid) [Roseomonas marmotae]|uniref:tail protein X n=1 Tax=Roseomonas marmotae TaxID=2768161 RepID=UPI001AD77FAC|nr:tail protein X [Roseomonas marmotae]QTI81505.1 tail protein X [Roseomonas marmotae]